MNLKRVGVGIASLAAATMLMGGTALAADYPGGNPPCCNPPTGNNPPTGVLPNNDVAPTDSAPVLAFTDNPAPAVSSPASSGPSLAFTGADILELTVIGGGMIVLGTVATRRRRVAVRA